MKKYSSAKKRLSCLCQSMLGVLTVVGMISQAVSADYSIGAGKYDITGAAAESNMWGYVNLLSTQGLQQRLFSRAFVIASETDPNQRVVLVSTDLGAIFQSVKLEVIRRLSQDYGDLYRDDNVMLTATHTHVGSGGLSHYTLQILAASDSTLSGYDSNNFETVVDGIVASIRRAHANLAPGSIEWMQGELNDVTLNRSLSAYQQNDGYQVYRHPTNNLMSMLKFSDDEGQPIGMINWFAIHNTSLSNQYTLLSGDNKGYAQYLFEKDFYSDHRQPKTFVAAFANSDMGDVVPKDGNANSAPGFEGDSEELLNAERAGLKQYQKAVTLFNQPGKTLSGQLAFKHRWAQMENYRVSPEFTGNDWQSLCSAARGASFVAGGENGPSTLGLPEGLTIDNSDPSQFQELFAQSPLGAILASLADGLSLSEPDECHGNKPILLSPGSLDWVPDVLPFQLFVVGDIAIIGVPAELTTMSGRYLRQDILKQLQPIGVNHAVIAGLANTYSGYVTTRPEYRSQQYEGASTEFGPYTLAAYRQNFSELAQAIVNGSEVMSDVPLDKSQEDRPERTDVILDARPLLAAWGDVQQDVSQTYTKGETVVVTFLGGHPKNNYQTQQSYLEVQKWDGEAWKTVAYDWDWNTQYHWQRIGIARSEIRIEWTIPQNAEAGTYRIIHNGHARRPLRTLSYQGVSGSFLVE